MKRKLSYVSAFLGLVILALLIIPFFVPQKIYVDFVQQKLEQKYPIKIQLKNARLSLLPSPSVKLNQTQLHVVSKEGNPSPFLNAKELEVSTSWWGLFFETIPFGLKLKEGTVIIKELKDNQFQFSHLIPEENKTTASTKKASSIVPISILLKNLSLEHEPYGQKKSTYLIKSFELGEVSATSQELSGKIESQFILPQAKDNTVEITSPFRYNLNAQKLLLDKTIINVDKIRFLTKAIIDLPKGQSKDIKGNIDIQSPRFSYKQDSITIHNQPLSVKTKIHKSNKKLTLSDGIAKLGPQPIFFNGTVPLDKGPSIFHANIKAIQDQYLKTLLTNSKDMPTIKNGTLNLTYNTKGSVTGHFAAKSLQTKTDTLQNPRADFSYGHGKLILKNIKAGLYDGSLTGHTSIHKGAKGNQSVLFDLFLKNASLKKIKSLHNHIEGKGSFGLKGSSSSLDKNWAKTLNANGQIKTLDVKIPRLEVLKNTFNQPVWEKASQIRGTGFDVKGIKNHLKKNSGISNINSKFTIKNGNIHLAKSKINMKDAYMILSGHYGIDGNVNLKGQLVLSKTLLHHGFKNKKMLDIITSPNNQLPLPLQLTGKMPHLKVTLDQAALLAHYQKSVIKLAKNQVQDEIKKKMREHVTQKKINTVKNKAVQSIPKIENKLKNIF